MNRKLLKLFTKGLKSTKLSECHFSYIPWSQSEIVHQAAARAWLIL